MKKILIIEDHGDIRRLIRMTLELESCQVFEAKNGDEGLDMALLLSPQLVLLDVMMPGKLNGLDLCRILKSGAPRPRVILLSARGRSEDLEAGMNAGADAYMVKPFSPLQLIEQVNRQLEAT